MERLPVEPVFFKAGTQREPRPVQDDPTVGRSDALVLTDGFGAFAEDLALEEDAPAGSGQAVEAFLEGLPEAALLEGRLGVAPGLRRRAPMPRLVEELVEPTLVLGGRGELARIEVLAIGRGAPLQVDHLEAQDRGEPGAQRRLAPERGDALERRGERLLD